jgi:hypothetical protein
MTLVAMTLLFMLEERILQKDSYPLLSCSDIKTLRKTTLPRRDLDREEVIRLMQKCHSINAWRHPRPSTETRGCRYRKRN